MPGRGDSASAGDDQRVDRLVGVGERHGAQADPALATSPAARPSRRVSPGTPRPGRAPRAARVAPAKTSIGPTASRGCTPGNATTTTWRSLMQPSCGRERMASMT